MNQGGWFDESGGGGEPRGLVRQDVLGRPVNMIVAVDLDMLAIHELAPHWIAKAVLDYRDEKADEVFAAFARSGASFGRRASDRLLDVFPNAYRDHPTYRTNPPG